MCGIVGFIGEGDAIRAVMEGLHSLEYRGYDSAGIGFLDNGFLRIIRTKGRVDDLAAKLPSYSPVTLAIGHTRWATHGAPVERNAHPHCDLSGRIALVHNGIIENYATLRQELTSQGAVFSSDTDSEIIAHLIAQVYRGDLLAAVEEILPRLDGTFALGILAVDHPDCLVAARRGSPLVIGLAEKANILASDAVPILPYTKRVIFLEDNQVALLRKDRVLIRADGKEIHPEVTEIHWSAEAAQKGGYKHFMLKEIFEQPYILEQIARTRVSIPEDPTLPPIFRIDGIELEETEVRNISRIVLLGQGTAYHACMVGRNLIERVARIPSFPEYASDFRYRDPILDPSVLVIAVTQSGETMDTLHAVKLAKERGCKVVSVVNVVGSSIARASDGVFYMHCGPEIGVASTKAFTAMIESLYILALRMGQIRGAISLEEQRRRALDIQHVGPHVETVLTHANAIRSIALHYADARNFLFLGRGTGWALAMEGALKLKEVSYIHAEGYDAAEMKHGPIALIDEKMPVLFIALKGRRYEKIISNIQEVKARGGQVIAIASHDDREIAFLVDDVIYIRAETGVMNSILCAVPLQLLAYYIADARGCDVDKPKNLAKSVTVE